jgi:hypothetical protein
MDFTVFITVLSGVLTYVLGQLILKLMIEPVQEMRKTIALISHSLIERANVISNPGVPTKEVMDTTAKELRKLSSQLQSHLYLVPIYEKTSKLFRLPTQKQVLAASSALIGLSNSVHVARDNVYDVNAERNQTICDSLGIFLPESDRVSPIGQPI